MAKGILDKAESRITLVEQIWKYLPHIYVAFSGAGSMGLAALTNWMNQFAPYSWFLAGLLGVLVALCSVAIVVRIQLWRASKEAIRAVIDPSATINPLDSVFNKVRINLMDLVHPISRKIENKTITDCELIGPAIIIFGTGTHADGIDMHECDAMIGNPNVPVKNSAVFLRCTIRNTEFYKMTIIFPKDMKEEIESQPGFQGWLAG